MLEDNRYLLQTMLMVVGALLPIADVEAEQRIPPGRKIVRDNSPADCTIRVFLELQATRCLNIYMRTSCQFRPLAQPVSAPTFATRIFAGHKGDRERLLAADFNGYVSKPFDVEELLGAVRTPLGR